MGTAAAVFYRVKNGTAFHCCAAFIPAGRGNRNLVVILLAVLRIAAGTVLRIVLLVVLRSVLAVAVVCLVLLFLIVLRVLVIIILRHLAYLLINLYYRNSIARIPLKYSKVL